MTVARISRKAAGAGDARTNTGTLKALGRASAATATSRGEPLSRHLFFPIEPHFPNRNARNVRIARVVRVFFVFFAIIKYNY